MKTSISIPRIACTWLLPLLLSLMLPATAQAQLNYVTNSGGTITITAGYCPSGAVVIPDRINGLPVTSIEGSAFYYCTSLTSVIIPDSVTNIGVGAFDACFSLANVTIGNRVTSIEANAFAFCHELTSVIIPDSVTSLGFGAFSYCRSLTNVTIGNRVTSIEANAFYSCFSLANVTIGNSVTNIGEWAFYACTNLTNVIIPDSVTSIGYWAFYYCFGLTSLIIPNSVTSIGNRAFALCSGLTNIIIPDSVTSIGLSAFSHCSSLTSVTIPDRLSNISYRLFLDCGNLTSVVIPASVASIDDYVFYACPSLTGVYFRGNAPIHGRDTFAYANNAIVHYLPGTEGWGPTFDRRPTAFWHLPYPVILSLPPYFGVQSNRFGFRVSWATNADVVVEASTNLTNPIWVSVGTNTISMGVDPFTGGWSHFSDPDWTNYPARFYRVRSP